MGDQQREKLRQSYDRQQETEKDIAGFLVSACGAAVKDA